MTKKDKPNVKVCVKCDHYQKPDAQHIRTTWCDNPKSAHNGTYVYKGDSCSAFVGKGVKGKVSDG